MTGEVKKSEITKRKIMQSAIRLFAQKDFASVGTREIATSINGSTIHNMVPERKTIRLNLKNVVLLARSKKNV